MAGSPKHSVSYTPKCSRANGSSAESIVAKPNIYDEIDYTMDRVTSLEPPACPKASPWEELAWQNYWREQQMHVLNILERVKWAGCDGLLNSADV